MKKKLCFVLACILLFSSATTALAAQESPVSSDNIITQYTEDLSDGYYVVVTLTEESSLARAQTKTASETYTVYNSSDEALAKYTLTATFTYDGSDAYCTSVSDSTTIYDDVWKFTSTNASYTGNVATGTFTLKRYLLGIVVDTFSDTLKIYCNQYGVIS